MATANLETVQKLEAAIKSHLRVITVPLLMAFVIPILAWVGVCQYDQDIGAWFQRSGSFTVVFAVWAEIKISHINNIIKPINDSYQAGADSSAIDSCYSKVMKVLNIIVPILVIIGTVIWGYGDIIKNEL
jgi:hypothetical protein